VSGRMFWTLTSLAFGAFALILFGFAFSRVLNGRIGAALVFGVLALIMCGATSAVAVYGID
jgi:hypothetical protein